MKASVPLAGLVFTLLLGLPLTAASEQDLRKMAEAGDATAPNRLGFMYYQGQGLPKNLAEAAKLYRKAADQGLAGAQHNLGAMFAAGEGVLRDPTEAVKWFRQAADQGLAQAQATLGVMYQTGEGVPQDFVEAYKSFTIAARQGLPEAEQNLHKLALEMTSSQLVEALRRPARNACPSHRTLQPADRMAQPGTAPRLELA